MNAQKTTKNSKPAAATKKTEATKSPSSATGNKRKVMVITPQMDKAIKEAKQFMKDKWSKADAAREVFDMLKNHERRQVIHVFINGIGLSKAGAGTYYQNCKR